MSIVRENLLTRKGYTPYCGGDACARMPRTVFTGTQFRCSYCGWQSDYEASFIKQYKRAQHSEEPLWWAAEFAKAGNYEGIADRLRFHGTLFVDDVVKRSGLSPQTVRKHLNRLVDDGRALRSTHLEDAYHHNKEDEVKDV